MLHLHQSKTDNSAYLSVRSQTAVRRAHHIVRQNAAVACEAAHAHHALKHELHAAGRK
jgi:hypothetical protein